MTSPMTSTEAELIERLDRIWRYADSIITTGFDRSSYGTAYSIRDEADALKKEWREAATALADTIRERDEALDAINAERDAAAQSHSAAHLAEERATAIESSLSALQADLDRAREALGPFGSRVVPFDMAGDDEDVLLVFKGKDYRRARAARALTGAGSHE